MFVLWLLEVSPRAPSGQTQGTNAQHSVPSEKDLEKLLLSHSTWNFRPSVCCSYHCGTELFSENILGIVSGLECLWLHYARHQQIKN